ncbi:MAG TPA: hypothetical protein VLB51_04640 [Methylomirabilota bacterium]|nr:hypothetical protein [Methylomirabilota bacterium]
MSHRVRVRTAWFVGAVLVAAGLPAILAGAFTGNGTQPPLLFPLNPPSVCAGCHGGFDSGYNVRPHTTWKGSMMANAGRDPLFWAALDVANHDLPGIGEWCLRCHAPAGWLAGRAAPPTGSADGCSLFGEIDGADDDFEGLTCSACHRLEVKASPPPGQQAFYLENGQYWISDTSCPNGFEPCRNGPYDYAPGDPLPPHPWAYSQYHVDSDACGLCHNVTNPVLTLIDENGVNTGVPMPVERTHKEWQSSSFAAPGPGFATCQNCHMPDATHDPAYPAIGGGINRSGDLPVHELVGGNAWVPRVLAGEYPALGRSAAFDATAAWAEQMLAAAASVAVSAPALVQGGEVLAFEVRVTNLTGHKLPTGYPEGRRMWLDVAVRDGHGAELWRSGGWDPVTGALAADPQLKVYEVKPGIWNRNGTEQCDTAEAGGNPLFHFVLNDCIALDNRIPPAGFTGGADLETRPVGYVYPETSPGSGVLVHWDDTAYAISIPADAAGPVTVDAVLQYQTTSDDYVLFLRDQALTHSFSDDCVPRSTGPVGMSRGELAHDVWTRYDRAPPEAMAVGSAAVELALFADGFESGGSGAWTATAP